MNNKLIYLVFVVFLVGTITAGAYSFNDPIEDEFSFRIPILTYWTAVGNNIYNSNSGKVGIGTTNPTYDFQVFGNSFFQGHLIQGGVYSQKINTFASGDTTPSVVAGNYFKTSNLNPTAITNFDNGVEGQIIYIFINDLDTDFTDNANIQLYRGLSWTTPATTDSLTLIYDGSIWREISRSDNS